jgi:hypothetical protein
LTVSPIEPREALARYAELAVTLQSELRLSGTAPRANVLRLQCQRVCDAFQALPSVVLAILQLQGTRGVGTFGPASRATLCMAMGTRLGLDPARVVDLGLAGLLQDLGSVELPDWTSSPKAEAEFGKALRRVPLTTTLTLGRGLVTPEVLQRIALAWETEPPHSDSAADKAPRSGIALLVTVAAAYDRLCSAVPPGLGLTSSHAMRIILFAGGRRYDERLTRLLATTVGLYAPGSVVELEPGARGVVVERPRDPSGFDRPVVRMLASVDSEPEIGRDGSVPDEDEEPTGPLDIDLGASLERQIVREIASNDGTMLSRFFLDRAR